MEYADSVAAVKVGNASDTDIVAIEYCPCACLCSRGMLTVEKDCSINFRSSVGEALA